jgi:O-antigen biosynthesis protein
MPDTSQRKRLLSWTGERCVPWADEPGVIYEHLHRYLFSEQFVTGKVVVDLGSGEGYGAKILAGRARRVIGVELDSLSVAHSRLHYESQNLSFVEGSVLRLDQLEDDSVDVAVCFEVIEHLSSHEQLLSEVARVLRSDGLLIMSTPDREVYNRELGHVNPYHLKELDRAEFAALLSIHFPHVAMYGQRNVAGSLIRPVQAEQQEGGAGTSSFTVQRQDGQWEPVPSAPPKYLVALASRAPLPPLPADSLMLDSGLGERPGPSLRTGHPVLGEAVLVGRSVADALRRRLALIMRARNRRRERRANDSISTR